MEFKGVFTAHPLVPAQYGIMSVARLTEFLNEHETAVDPEEKWLRGFSHVFETKPTINLLSNDGSIAHVISNNDGASRYIDVKPFFIETVDFASTFGLLGEDRYERVRHQLEAGTQKAVEHEFYHGYSAIANGNSNQYLTKASTAQIIELGALKQMQEGLGYLEYALAQSPLGEQGVIHMTRDMAALLGSQWILERPSPNGKPHLETTNGTPIVIGSGYDGSGPYTTIATTAISGSNVATITTTTPHGLSMNDPVTIENETAAYFNGTWTVTTVANSTTFTFALTHTSQGQTAGTGNAFFSPDRDTKWMWGTGIIDVNLGDIEIVNMAESDGYDSVGNKNDIRIKAYRPASVHHDPAMHYGVKVQVHQ